jgi:tRNA threonylcarbamoyladenosine biosynthesis protein TsaB
MAYLAFDTSTKVLSVAVAKNNILCADFRINLESYTHSEYLMPIISQALEISKIDKKEICAIGVVKGPGSFTGLRIGLAVAKGLGVSLGVDVYAYTSLELLAAKELGSKEPTFAILPAQRGEIYGGLFDVEFGRPVLLGEYFIGKVENALAQILESYNSLRVVGEGFLKFESKIRLIAGKKLVYSDELHHLNSASNMISLMNADVESGRNKVNIMDLEPFYMRLSAAEEQKRK